jgi:nucleoside-diphosphate-sugar epimerase
MKALVTGGAGFIGSHIAQALVGKGAKVVIFDDLSGGDLANLAWAKGEDAVEFVKGTICDPAAVRAVVAGCDWVFHQAALTSVPKSVGDPIRSNAINLEACIQLLAAARGAGVKRFFFASSAAVYGESEESPKRESFAVAPVSPYGLQKYAAERYAQLFHRHYGLETVCFRYFNVFGPRQAFTSPYSGAIARFCTAALAGETLTVFGDGHQTRDFVYVDNVVQANLLAASAPASKVAGRVFNLGSAESVSLLQLINELEHTVGRRLALRFEQPRAGDIRHSSADISAIQNALGFGPVVSWQEGLKRTLDWYRAQGKPASH